MICFLVKVIIVFQLGNVGSDERPFVLGGVFPVFELLLVLLLVEVGKAGKWDVVVAFCFAPNDHRSRGIVLLLALFGVHIFSYKL